MSKPSNRKPQLEGRAGSGPVIDWLERVRYGMALVRGTVHDLAVLILTVVTVVLTVLVTVNGGDPLLPLLAWLVRQLRQ